MSVIYQKRNGQLVQVSPSTDVAKRLSDAEDKLTKLEQAGGFTLEPATTDKLGGVKTDGTTTFTDTDGTFYTRVSGSTLSDAAPQPFAPSASAGVSVEISRADHVHEEQDLQMDSGCGAENLVLSADYVMDGNSKRKLLVNATKPDVKIFLPSSDDIAADGVAYIIRCQGDYDVTVVSSNGGAVGADAGKLQVNKTRIYIMTDEIGSWMSSEWDGFVPEKLSEYTDIELGTPIVQYAAPIGLIRHDENNVLAVIDPYKTVNANTAPSLNPQFGRFLYNDTTHSLTYSIIKNNYNPLTYGAAGSFYYIGEKDGYKIYVHPHISDSRSVSTVASYPYMKFRLYGVRTESNGSLTWAYSALSSINLTSTSGAISEIVFSNSQTLPELDYSIELLRDAYHYVVPLNENTFLIFGSGLKQASSSGNGVVQVWVARVSIVYGDTSLGQKLLDDATVTISTTTLLTLQQYTYANIHSIRKISDTQVLIAVGMIYNKGQSSYNVPHVFLLDASTSPMTFKTAYFSEYYAKLYVLINKVGSHYIFPICKNGAFYINEFVISTDGSLTIMETASTLPDPGLGVSATLSSVGFTNAYPGFGERVLQARYTYKAGSTNTYYYAFYRVNDDLTIELLSAQISDAYSPPLVTWTNTERTAYYDGSWSIPLEGAYTATIAIRSKSSSSSMSKKGYPYFCGYIHHLDSTTNELDLTKEDLCDTTLGYNASSYVNRYTHYPTYIKLRENVYLLHNVCMKDGLTYHYYIPCRFTKR